MLVLGHHLREAVGVQDKVVARGRGGPEGGVGVDVGAEVDLAGELLGDVQVVAGDHLDVDERVLDLGDGLGGVDAGRVHDGQGAGVYHGAALLLHAHGDGLVAALAKGGVGGVHLGHHLVVVVDRPLLAAVALDGLEHLGHDALSHADLLARRLVDVVRDGALDDRVEAVVLLEGVAGEQLLRGRVDVLAVARHLGVGLVDGTVDGVVLVGGVGGERRHLEHLLTLEAVEDRGRLVVDGHGGGGQRAAARRRRRRRRSRRRR